MYDIKLMFLVKERVYLMKSGKNMFGRRFVDRNEKVLIYEEGREKGLNKLLNYI